MQLQEDQSIFRMRYLGEIEFGATVKNLTAEVGVSRSIFHNFPQQVKHDTAYERNCKLAYDIFFFLLLIVFSTFSSWQ